MDERLAMRPPPDRGPGPPPGLTVLSMIVAVLLTATLLTDGALAEKNKFCEYLPIIPGPHVLIIYPHAKTVSFHNKVIIIIYYYLFKNVVSVFLDRYPLST